MKKGGSGTFGFVNGDEVKTTTLRIVLDGKGVSMSTSTSVSVSARPFLPSFVRSS